MKDHGGRSGRISLLEIGLSETRVEAVNDLDCFGVSYRNGFWTNAHDVAIVFMQLDVKQFRPSTPDFEESPNIRQRSKGWPRDSVQPPPKTIINKVNQEGPTEQKPRPLQNG